MLKPYEVPALSFQALKCFNDLNWHGKTLLMVTHNEQMSQECKARLALMDG